MPPLFPPSELVPPSVLVPPPSVLVVLPELAVTLPFEPESDALEPWPEEQASRKTNAPAPHSQRERKRFIDPIVVHAEQSARESERLRNVWTVGLLHQRRARGGPGLRDDASSTVGVERTELSE